MKSHGKKMIAPIVVTILLVVYYVVYFGVLAVALDGALKVIFGLVPLVLSGITAKVCIDRIQEIRKGEEDDLSQY